MPSYYNENTIVYRNGEFIKAKDATVDLYSQSVHYGYSVFEGIRSYRTMNGATKIFKAAEHFQRFRNSAVAMNMPYTWDVDELTRITYTLLEKNNFQDAYIRPVVYAPANMSFSVNTVSHLVIEAWEMTPFLGDKLLRIMTSSFQRPNPRGFHIEAKAGGHYVNSILASQEAKAKGFDEALLTDMNEHIAEGPGANMFFEKDGVLYTPPAGNILPGITRATVIELCGEAGIPVVEKLFKADELKNADAAFFCGTAAEIIGWLSLDNYRFPKEWASSLGYQVQLAYADRIVEKTLRPVTVATARSEKVAALVS